MVGWRRGRSGRWFLSALSEVRPTPIPSITDPQATIWVSANAGSGKTYVLSRRVIRLLLEGAKPAELLCLTFTNAAAAEMANRVFDILGEWVLLRESDLESAIREIIGKKPTQAMISRARQLFTLALDTPGGLRIQTIHAFCESLLHRFTLEANVPGHFELIDPLQQKALIEEARRSVLQQAGGEGSLAGAIELIRSEVNEQTFQEALTAMIEKRSEFTDWLLFHGSVDQGAMVLANKLAIDPEESEVALCRGFRQETHFPTDELNRLHERLVEKGGRRASETVSLIDDLKNAKEAHEHHEARRALFFSGDDKKKPRAYWVSSNFMTDNAFEQAFRDEQALLAEQTDRLLRLRAWKMTTALLRVAEATLQRHAELKQRGGLLDFDDLIEKTAMLLTRSGIAPWVQYKLDYGIAHVLIDEAQDTSPLQWRIIEAITSEFYVGHGANQRVRTMFVVGDEKQSIFSFQGADPAEFGRQYRKIMRRAEEAGRKHERIPLQVSYRSTQDILSAVDQVFSFTENARGLGVDEDGIVHVANRRNDPGEVVVWPLEEQPEKPEKEHWFQPPDKMVADAAQVRLARRIARTIDGWIGRGEKLPGRDEPIRPGNILILVRKRDRFVTEMARELRNLELKSAGADRLRLTHHIATEDLLALGRFASNSLDDLSLAALLKSPLFGLSDDDLIALCIHREGALYPHLRILLRSEKVSGLSDALVRKLSNSLEILDEIRRLAIRLPVYEFFAAICARHRLRERYISILGHEVEEVLEGFFEAAIDFGRNGGLGLTSFCEWLASVEPELKRSIDMKTDEIRIITAHSAKGLEKPIVFLVDGCGKAYDERHAPKIVSLGEVEDPWLPLWQWKKAGRISAAEPAFQRKQIEAEEEYRRLLYVGMTRAADRLIVCGFCRTGGEKHDHWHKMVLRSLKAPQNDTRFAARLTQIDDEDGLTTAFEWRLLQKRSHEKHSEPARKTEWESDGPLPGWLGLAPPEPAPERPIAPSGVLGLLEIEDTKKYGPLAASEGADGFGMIRGTLVHELMQVLAVTEKQHRKAVVNAYFQRFGEIVSPPMQAIIEDHVLEAIANETIESLLRSGARTEVAVTGTIRLRSGERLVSGRIDLLHADSEKITIVDYKTDRHVPADASSIAPDYLAQMAIYRMLASQALQSASVDCYILWTETAAMMRVPDRLIERQVARILQA